MLAHGRRTANSFVKWPFCEAREGRGSQHVGSRDTLAGSERAGAPRARVNAVCPLTTSPADRKTLYSKGVGCTARSNACCHDRRCYAKRGTHLNKRLLPAHTASHSPLKTVEYSFKKTQASVALLPLTGQVLQHDVADGIEHQPGLKAS